MNTIMTKGLQKGNHLHFPLFLHNLYNDQYSCALPEVLSVVMTSLLLHLQSKIDFDLTSLAYPLTCPLSLLDRAFSFYVRRTYFSN